VAVLLLLHKAAPAPPHRLLLPLAAAAVDGALYMLPSLYEASVKAKRLSAALAALSLQACLKAGLWSDTDPECISIEREQLAAAGVPYPDIRVRASARSWMRQPEIHAGKMVELEVVVERAHAGESNAKHQKKVPRDGKLVPVMETYACIISRETDTDGGSKGSIVGCVDVDVYDVKQEEAKGILKIVAPKLPGTYEFCVYVRSAVLLGVRAEAKCSFDVVSEQPTRQEADSDYD